MADLGNIALWIALLIGVWGCATAFVGGLKGRPDLAQSAERAMYVVWGLLAVASLGAGEAFDDLHGSARIVRPIRAPA